MTCREKLKMDYPDVWHVRSKVCCPQEFGYAEQPKACYVGSSYTCSECWDREVQPYEDKITIEPVTTLSNKSLVDEICEARKKFIDAGFSANEAFNLVWDIFKGRWEQ